MFDNAGPLAATSANQKKRLKIHAMREKISLLVDIRMKLQVLTFG
jgi:hypothetical protein